MAQKFASMNPKTFTEGSGLFDDVDFVVKDVQYTKDAPEGYEAEGNPIFAGVTMVLAGDGEESERTVTQSYSLGAKAGDKFTIHESGYGLVPVDDHASVNKSTKWGTFLAVLANEGFPEDKLDAGDMKCLIGLSAHGNRVADKARTFSNKPTTSKYPQTTFVVTKIHALPGQVAAGKVAAKSSAATAGNGAAANVEIDPNETIDDAAGRYLLDILALKKGSVQRSQLTLLASKVAYTDPRRQDIAKRMGEEAFLNTAMAWKYDPTSKGQLITA